MGSTPIRVAKSSFSGLPAVRAHLIDKLGSMANEDQTSISFRSPGIAWRLRNIPSSFILRVPVAAQAESPQLYRNRKPRHGSRNLEIEVTGGNGTTNNPPSCQREGHSRDSNPVCFPPGMPGLWSRQCPLGPAAVNAIALGHTPCWVSGRR